MINPNELSSIPVLPVGGGWIAGMGAPGRASIF